MSHKIMKNIFYNKVFITMIVINFLLSDIGFILNYSFLQGLSVVSKVSSVILFLISLLYILISGRLKLFSQSYTLILFAIIGFGVGGFRNGINVGTFSHFYSFVMPITVSSVGYYFAQNYNDSSILRKYSYNCVKTLVFIEFGLMMIYIYLRNSGIFYANSFGAGGLIFGTLFFLANKKYKLSIFTLIGVILSNKRSSLLIIGIGIIAYLWQISRGRITKKIRNIIIIISAIIALVIVYNYTHYLNRFDVLLKIDFSDLNSIHIATSYRTLEMEYVIRYLFDDPINFIFGGGFGSEIFNGFKYVSYIHFSPLNYSFIGGVPFALLMYSFFTLDSIKSLRVNNKILQWINISWIFYFILTFTAATVSTHILTWFILGALKFSNSISQKGIQ